MNLTYTPMTMNDYDEMLALWNATPNMVLSRADDREHLGRFLNKNPGQSFVCRADGALVGTILCGNDGRRAYIYHTAVHPDYRRRGLGRHLAERAITQQKDVEKMVRVQLNIFRTNEQARAFWSELGFVMRDTVDHMILMLDEL